MFIEYFQMAMTHRLLEKLGYSEDFIEEMWHQLHVKTGKKMYTLVSPASSPSL